MDGGFGVIYRKLLSFLGMFGAFQFVLMGTVYAGPPVIGPPGGAGAGCGATNTIGGVLCNLVVHTEDSQAIFPALCYLFGIFIGVWAIAKLYEHVTNPHQVSAWEPIKKAIVAGALFALPIVMEAVYQSLVGASPAALNADFRSGTPTGGGLDAMVVALMSDAFKPFSFVLMMFCYFAGCVLVIVGIMRLMKSAQEGPRGPGGFGTIMTFLVAGALFAADEMMSAATVSLFSTNAVAVNPTLKFDAGLKAIEREHIISVISAVLAFVMVLGWISFVRGWFIIRNVAEGDHQASLMAGMTHILGGALAINLGPVLNAVQETFGLAAIGVNFGF